MPESVAGVVLAGGRGSRLGGVNKALLEVAGQPNLARVVAALGPLCTELVAVVNDPVLLDWPGLRVVLDQEPHAGVLPALAQGLGLVAADLALVVACDMPFLSRDLLADLIARACDADVVVPVVDGRQEPMHAVYRVRTCLPTIRAALVQGRHRMIGFFDQVRVVAVPESELRRLDPELRSFFNTNTPADLRRARALANDD